MVKIMVSIDILETNITWYIHIIIINYIFQSIMWNYNNAFIKIIFKYFNEFKRERHVIVIEVTNLTQHNFIRNSLLTKSINIFKNKLKFYFCSSNFWIITYKNYFINLDTHLLNILVRVVYIFKILSKIRNLLVSPWCVFFFVVMTVYSISNRKCYFVGPLKGVVLRIANSFLSNRENWTKSYIKKKKKNGNIYGIRGFDKIEFLFYCNLKIIFVKTWNVYITIWYRWYNIQTFFAVLIGNW